MAEPVPVVADAGAQVPEQPVPVEEINAVPPPPQVAPAPKVEVKKPAPATIAPPKGKLLSLPVKAKDWAQKNPALAIGGAAGTAVLATLIAGAYPLWKKIIQPRLEKMKSERSTGRHVKRSVDDEYVDELISDPEFVEFLEGLAAELEE